MHCAFETLPSPVCCSGDIPRLGDSAYLLVRRRNFRQRRHDLPISVLLAVLLGGLQVLWLNTQVMLINVSSKVELIRIRIVFVSSVSGRWWTARCSPGMDGIGHLDLLGGEVDSSP